MELRDNFEIESFYQWMEEIEGYGAFCIPVECDDNPELCADCEDELAFLEVTYKRKGIAFRELVCMKCYSHPDYQVWKQSVEIIKIRLI